MKTILLLRTLHPNHSEMPIFITHIKQKNADKEERYLQIASEEESLAPPEYLLLKD